MFVKRYLRMYHLFVSILLIMMGTGGGGSISKRLQYKPVHDNNFEPAAIAPINGGDILPINSGNIPPIIIQTNLIVGIPEEVPFPLPALLAEHNSETPNQREELGVKVTAIDSR